MDTKNSIVCKKCGAQSTGYITYCPHCGALLPLKSAKVTVEDKDLNRIEKNVIELASNLKYSYKSPYARKCDGYNFDTINTILCYDFLDKAKITKKKADSYDNILMYGIFGLIGVCFLAAIVCVSIAIFEDEPKTGIEIVKDEATGKYGIYNHDKDFLATPYKFDSIKHRTWVDQEHYKRNYCVLFSEKLLGIADSTGVIRIPCELNEIEGAYGGLIISRQNGYEGLFDTYGAQIFKPNNYRVLWEATPPLDYYNPGTYVGNIIPIKRNNNSGWELFDRTGRKIINKTYPKTIQTGAPDLIKVKYNGYYGLVNSKGEVVVECKATWISRFKEGIAFVYVSAPANIYAIDELGNKIFSPTLPRGWSLWLVSEGLFAVKDTNEGKIGYYDKTGKLVIPHKFEQAHEGNNLVNPSFQGDSARISYNGQNGYVFKDGSIKLDAQ